MNWLTFAQAEHFNQYGSLRARYDIDWTTYADEKYKLIISGVHVYESGRIVILRNAARDPCWNSGLERALGIRFVNPKGLCGVRLFTPEGRPVPKSYLGSVTHLLYLEKWGRLYSVSYRCPITFISPDAQPCSQGNIVLQLRNIAAEKEYMLGLSPFIALGETLNAVSPNLVTGHLRLSTYLRNRSYPDGTTTESAQMFCRGVAAMPESRNKIIKTVCADTVSVPYLVVK